MDLTLMDLHGSTDYARLKVTPRLCGRLRCGAGWCRDRAASGRLDDHELWLVWAGRGAMRTHAGDFELRPGFCAWMRPGGIYDAQTEASPRHRLGITYIHFDLQERRGGKWRKLDATRSAGHEFQHAPYLTYMEIVTRRIVQLANHDATGDPSAEIAAGDLLRALLIDWQLWAKRTHRNDTDRVHRETIGRIAAAMRDDPAGIAPVAELAAGAGYSTSHFHDLFKRVLGVGPQQFAIQVKIERARQLLSESDASVGRIAEQLGYRDVYFFSRQFRQVTGMAPSGMRR
ncbi:MAG: helix-turn-helix transcriptional regulator [Phycisphaerales bacterium]